jgi:NADPH-dependent 2,4-dienoyl-CoA reductase/sulfur reductase-like enzyme
MRAAETLRYEGHNGPITIVGTELHWPPYDRPPLSKQVLAGAWDDEKGRLRVADAFDAQLRLGVAATELDLNDHLVTLADGATLPYDGLIVATGASPRLLPGVELGGGVHVLRTIDDCVALRGALESARRVTVVGAGFIGCEVAATCRQRGLEVTVVEALPLPLVRVLGIEAGEFCAALHRDNDVDLRLAAPVASVEGTHVHLTDGDVVEGDVVVVGVGVAPVTGWLDGSGLTIDDGVVCDETLTARGADDVVCAGDITRWPNQLFGPELTRIEHWTNAAEQGEHAARSLRASPDDRHPFMPVPYFWSEQFGVRFQFIGTCRPGDEFVLAEGSMEERRFVAAYVRGQRTVGALCVNRPNRTLPWRAHIAGEAPWPAP